MALWVSAMGQQRPNYDVGAVSAVLPRATGSLRRER